MIWPDGNRGPTVTPAAACAPGIVTKPTQALFVLSANLRCYLLRGLQNLCRGTRCQVISAGGNLGLAHKIQRCDHHQQYSANSRCPRVTTRRC